MKKLTFVILSALKKIVIVSVLFYFDPGRNDLHAQNVIPVTGGIATGSGGSVSYTVGQIVNSSLSGTNGTVAQGVQQPYEISVITAIEESKGITLEMIVYPNPATDFIWLKIESFEPENLRYQLYDNDGRVLQNNKVDGNEMSIEMSTYSSGIYFLKVIQDNKLVKTFKIIKN